MSIGAHTIQPPKGTRHKTKRVGRGNGSQKGTYSARGGKGQTARSGGRRGNKRRGLKPSLQKIPKIRGFKSGYEQPQTVTFKTLERITVDGSHVTPSFLKAKGVIHHAGGPVKIVGTGELKKKITVTGCLATKSAAQMIEKAGGKIVF